MSDVLAPSKARPISIPLTAACSAATVLTSVLSGALLVTWLSEASLDRSSELWVGYHQAVTPTYTRALPPIGALALLATLAALAASWTSRRDRRLVLAAVSCLLIGLAVTVVVHLPINAEIATWRPATPPADWQGARDRWLAAHAVRSALTLVGLALLLIARLGRRGAADRRELPSFTV